MSPKDTRDDTPALTIVNPNSNAAVTAAMDEAVAPLRALGPIRCTTLAEGPPGIESQRDADRVIAPLLAHAKALEPVSTGFVVACFRDPGLHALREATTLPVLGIQEAGVLTAMTLGHRFGILAILRNSVPRHLRILGAMGVTDRLAGDRPLGLTVAELADRDRAVARMAEVGADLRDRDGADVLILGCAGMAWAREPVARATGLPVVEPCQAAAAMALGRIALGWHRTPQTEAQTHAR